MLALWAVWLEQLMVFQSGPSPQSLCREALGQVLLCVAACPLRATVEAQPLRVTVKSAPLPSHPDRVI